MRLALNADYSIVVMSEFDAMKKADSLRRYSNFANLINISGPIPGINIKDLTATLERDTKKWIPVFRIPL